MSRLIDRRRMLATVGAASAAAALSRAAGAQPLSLEPAPLARRVSVLHIGDSHIASDAFSRGVRARLQSAFGDGGRGSMIPAGAFGRARADRARLVADEEWTFHNSLRPDDVGPYGISGMRLEGAFGAQMTLELDHDAEEIEVVFASGPGGGSAWIGYLGGDGLFDAFVDTASDAAGPGVYANIGGAGRAIRVAQTSDAPVSVLRWGAWRRRPGVVYMNFGIPGATARLFKSWNRDFFRLDIATIDPDYVVLGYGTNEGVDFSLDVTRHRREYVELVEELRAYAPRAKLVFITPPSAARAPTPVIEAHGAPEGPCGPSPVADLAEYAALARDGDERLATRHEPPMMQAVRDMIEDVAADYGSLLWRWEAAMGGPCSVDDWARRDPPMAQSDRIHLTALGYDRSAASFADYLAGLIRDDFF